MRMQDTVKANGQSMDAVLNQKQIEAQMMMLETINNVMTSRQDFVNQFLDPRRDTDKECGYPNTREITPELYRKLYDREPIATRIVKVLPEESWQHTPEVYEDEDSETETPFERAWDELAQTLRGKSWYKDEEGSPIWEHLKRADILSGIGHFGILLLGFNDGELLQNPVKGAPPDGWAQDITGVSDVTKTPNTGENPVAASPAPPPYASQVPSGDPYLDSRYGTDSQYGAPPYGTIGKPMTGADTQGEGIKLLFIRAFDESLVQIVQYEANINNPRFGQPVRYKVTLNDPREQHAGVGLPLATIWVHWSRVIHLADNLNSSEIFGAPRMRPVYNRILDLVKLYGGSAEMYWRGAFPGLSIETHPQLGGDVQIDGPIMRNMMERYQNSLQRYIQLSGMSAKSLAPQVVDPTPQINVQIEAICIQLGIPQRIFQGSERGELASTQDAETWNNRIHERQCNYLTPRVIVPFIDRLIMVGVLPEPNSSQDEDNDLAAAGSEDYESGFDSEQSGDGEDQTSSLSKSQGQTSKKNGNTKKVKQGYCVKWPDLNILTKGELAQSMLVRTQAMAAYVSGQVEALMDPMDYLVREGGFTEEEARTIIENVTKHLEDSHPDTEEEVMPGHIPAPPPPEIPPGSPIKMGQGETLFDPNSGDVMHETKPAPLPPKSGGK